MYVLEVLPLATLPPNTPQILSYYHDTALPKGAVVEVDLHHRTVTAAVVDCYALEHQKILLKKSSFQLKQVSGVISAEPLVADWQFKIVLWIAHHYMAPLGSVMKTVLPPFFLKKRYPISLNRTGSFLNEPSPVPGAWVVTRARQAEKHIRAILKSANPGQTLLLVPDTSYIPYFQNMLPDFRPDVITSATPNKDYNKTWNDVSSRNVDLIIGTRQAMFLPFADLRAIIVIDPLHEFYKSDMSPKYWTPEVAEMIAAHHGARVTHISSLLGVQGYHKLQEQNITITDASSPWAAEVKNIDMTAELKRGEYLGILAPQTREALAETTAAGGRTLILAARRGYSGIILCQHCGFSFKCPDCNLPMRVHQGMKLSLVCHHCNRTEAYPPACPNCHSSQIKPTGPAGSQKIFEELQRMMTYGQLKRAPVLILDADVTQNETEEQEVIDAVRNPVAGGPAPILIATQKVYSYIYDLNFDTVIVPQLDALTVGSDFQALERVWYQFEKLADFLPAGRHGEPTKFVVQSFHQSNLVPTLARQEYASLYQSELTTRQAFWYPPFCRLVKLTYTHRDSRNVIAAARAAVEKLKMAAGHVQARDKVKITETSPLFLKKDQGLYTYTILIKIAPDFPPRDLLRFVPAHWLIDLDPRTTT